MTRIKSDPLEEKRKEEEVLLEATRGEKEFQLIRVTLEKIWEKKNSPWSPKSTYSRDSKSYEFNWRNIGSNSWGRTEILTEKGKVPTQAGAFRTFFSALNASEHMTFKELVVTEI